MALGKCLTMIERRLWPTTIIVIWLAVLTCVLLVYLSLQYYYFSLFHMNVVYTLHIQNHSRFSYPINQLPTTDYNQLIDLRFSFFILNLVCIGSKPLLLVLVHSAPKHFEKRRTIRETWGRNEEDIKILFMLGIVDSSDLQKTLEDENRLQNDIIQGNFLDSYYNMTYKHTMVFKYVIYHCPQARYILKTDDDVFVNMPMLKTFLNVDLSIYGAKNVLFCTTEKNARIRRSYRSKWRVSFSRYPNRNYPTYCSGWTILYSPDVIFALYKEVQNADYFWIDDVHITGTLAEKVNLAHVDSVSLVIYRKELSYIVQGYSYEVTKPFLYGGPDINEKEIRALWKYVSTHFP